MRGMTPDYWGSGEWLIQLTEDFFGFGDGPEEKARAAFSEMTRQAGYRGGRVLPPAASRPSWRLQVFFRDEPEAAEGAKFLPDGLRRVWVPASQASRLGIRPPA